MSGKWRVIRALIHGVVPRSNWQTNQSAGKKPRIHACGSAPAENRPCDYPGFYPCTPTFFPPQNEGSSIENTRFMTGSMDFNCRMTQMVSMMTLSDDKDGTFNQPLALPRGSRSLIEGRGCSHLLFLQANRHIQSSSQYGWHSSGLFCLILFRVLIMARFRWYAYCRVRDHCGSFTNSQCVQAICRIRMRSHTIS
jgi:hypothetical protein